MMKEGVTILTTSNAFKSIEVDVDSSAVDQDSFMTTVDVEQLHYNASFDTAIFHSEESNPTKNYMSKKRTNKETIIEIPENNLKKGLLNQLASSFEDFILPMFSISADITQKNFMDSLMKLNATIHNDRQRLFYYVKAGDIGNLKDQLAVESKRHRSESTFLKFLMQEVDANGANIIHLAYLNEFYEMGHYLVACYPELALQPYQDNIPEPLRRKGYSRDMMPYTGENILHMVIVRRNYEEVRWVLDFFKDHKDSVPNGLSQLLISNATGKFFDVKGNFYFGGYPLQFAVCANSIEIFDLVLSFASTTESEEEGTGEIDDKNQSGKLSRIDAPSLGPNVIFMRDSYGNTVLHLCVTRCLQNMFDHVYKVAETILSREIKLQYTTMKAKDASVNTPFNLDSTEEIAKIKTGYSVTEEMLRLPPDDKLEEWIIRETSIKMNERLLLVLNNDLHSPLTLASNIKKVDENEDVTAQKLEMLSYLLTKLKTVLWQFGPTQCYEVNLEGLEVKYNLTEYNVPPTAKVPVHESVISWLCIYDVEPAIMIPEVRRIIEIKWERCGLPKFLAGFAVDLFLLILITLLLVFGTHTPVIGLYYFVNILYVLIILTFLRLIYEEYRQIQRYGDTVRRLRGIAWYHVVCRNLKMLSFITYCILRFYTLGFGYTDMCSAGDIISVEEYPEIKIPFLVCVFVCWFHLYFYLMCFESTGLYVLTLSRIIVRDFPHFLRFYVISLFAFSSAISLLGNSGNPSTKYAFWHYVRTLWSLVHETVVSIPPDDQTYLGFVPDDLRIVSDLWNTIFFYSVAFVMINLLIAIINSTYKFYTSYNEKTKGFNNEAILLIEKFNVMDFYEEHLSEEELHENRDTYALARYMGENKEFVVESTTSSVKTNINELNTPTSKLGTLRRGSFRRLADEIEEDVTEVKEPIIKYFFQYEEEIRGWLDVPTSSLSDDSSRRSCLMLIEPQMDFQPGGPMGIPGADKEWTKIAKMIVDNKADITEIMVVLDSHFSNHIAHQKFWEDRNGHHPKPKTIISHENVKNGVWRPREKTSDMMEWCLTYTRELERSGKMKLTIWPEHCIIGGRGHTIVPVINEALAEWASHSKRTVNFIMKGQNCRTEMYSALHAEVEDPLDSSTAFNSELMSDLRVAERVRSIF